MTKSKPAFAIVADSSIPEGIRFDVPRENQGQIVERA